MSAAPHPGTDTLEVKVYDATLGAWSKAASFAAVTKDLTAAQYSAAASLLTTTNDYIVNKRTSADAYATTGYGDGLTISDRLGAVTDIVSAGGGSETFEFDARFGHVEITDFVGHSSGAAHDFIELDKGLFAYLTPDMDRQQDIGALLSHAASSDGALILSDSRGDALRLDHVSAAQFKASAADIKFIG